MRLRAQIAIALFLFVVCPLNLSTARAADQNFSRQEIIYGRKYGTALTLDVFKPSDKANGAAIIYAASGGWYSDHNGLDGNSSFIKPFVDHGYTVFAVIHGSNPKFDLTEIRNDMNRAVRFIRHNASQYGIDSKRIGIIGGSAGGHLSLMQGCAGGPGDEKSTDPVNRETSAVEAVVAFYPPTDFLNWGEPGHKMLGAHPIVPIKGAFDFQQLNPQSKSFDLITDEPTREQIGRDVSPINHVSKDNPPTLIIHGTEDALVPLQQSEDMAAKMTTAGATCKLIVKQTGHHDGQLIKEFLPQAIAWFDEYLR